LANVVRFFWSLVSWVASGWTTALDVKTTCAKAASGQRANRATRSFFTEGF
jgi:hypothetical protein